MSGAPLREPSPGEDERELVERASRGDSEAFADLFHRHRDVAYRVARSVLGDREAALDALQDTFLKVHQSLSAWRGDSALRTWIVRIAVRAAIDLRRRESRAPRYETPLEPSHDPGPAMERELLLARLRELSARLNGRQGLVLRLRLFGGLTNREIAEALELREPNVRMQLTKAVRRLREML